MRTQITAAVLLIIAATACQPSHPAPAAPQAALTVATQHYAALLRAGSADSIAAAFTPEGELLIPGVPPLRGREAIRGFLAPMADSTVVTAAEMHADSTEIFGSLADQFGHYRQTTGPKGGVPHEYHGRYQARWQRGADGSWRIARLTMQPAAGP
ncbi:MAG TPA: nuclear transport factor 2 family protein [Gemmatimonadaceae bacterium]|nr:nuclear transport factor 2 family protein [Gemmatimonadaceae bacterium]